MENSGSIPYTSHKKNTKQKNSFNKQKSIIEKIRTNPWIISTFVFAFFAIFLITGNFSAGISGQTISQEKAGDLVMNFVKSQAGEGAELVSVSLESGLYKVIILFKGSQIPLYITKDGKSLVQVIAPLSSINSGGEDSSKNSAEIPQTDKPKIQLFVMSFCPFGNRAENTMLPVYNLLKDKVDWDVNYIVSVSGDKVNSLHGQPEVDQNIREVCVKNEYGLDKFWEFITYVNDNCGKDGSCWKEAANSIGLDTNKIQTCYDEQGLELMKKEAQISSAAGARGSPTLLINRIKSNSVYEYENSEAYKDAICSSFTNAPEECGTALEGISSETTAGGSCN